MLHYDSAAPTPIYLFPHEVLVPPRQGKILPVVPVAHASRQLVSQLHPRLGSGQDGDYRVGEFQKRLPRNSERSGVAPKKHKTKQNWLVGFGLVWYELGSTIEYRGGIIEGERRRRGGGVYSFHA